VSNYRVIAATRHSTEECGMTNLFKEFKEFALKGNLVQTAVAFVMGVAFAAVITSLVEKVIMPIIGIIFGEPSFDQVMILEINGSEILFGAFLQAVVVFTLTALALFLFVVKPYNAMSARYEKGEEEPPATPEDIQLLREIRDSLSR
jgi:large conductance mechanosensitive channel